ncbi:unnamed protein product [Owenia fusiformis]|uniref:Uncharacterized protein n=1 Tax=Owenia fusiformis TaxID=6347 RepID=A0A8S4N117_OWEFU|nr:unnamed protein product [Owenia fusiformis]
MKILKSLCVVFSLVFMTTGEVPEDSTGFKLLFTSIEKEVEDVPLKFELPGGIPKWVRGTLVKNGPGKFEMGDKKVVHTFDGFAKLSSWKFPGDGESVFFSTKMQQTNYYKDSVATNTIAPYVLFAGTIPEENTMEKMQRMMNGMNNNPVNVYETSKTNPDPELVALNDMWKLYTFNMTKLELKKTYTPFLPKHIEDQDSSMKDFLENIMGIKMPEVPGLSSAHPLFEYKKDNWVTYYVKIELDGQSEFSVIRLGEDMVPKEVTSWKVDSNAIPYMHSFAVTENYAAFFATPCFFDFPNLMAEGTFDMKSAMRCDPNDPMVVHVVDLRTGKMTKLETKYPGLIIHFVNSYETDNGTKIVADCTHFPGFEQLTGINIPTMMNVEKRNKVETPNRLTRFTLDLTTLTVTTEHLHSMPSIDSVMTHIDFPVINENHRSLNYCNFWGTISKADNIHYGKWAIGKKNVCGNPNADLIWHKPNHYPMEPWFIPRPDATSEDDGVVITSILDGEKGKNYLAVLNGTTLEMMNYAYMPIHLPMDFHGRFIANKF